MKNIFTLAMLVYSLNAMGQRSLKNIDDEANRKKTGDDKAVLVPVLGALANLVGQDEQTILFQPTLYSIGTILNSTLKSDANYARMQFARSLQFNLGIITSEESIFKYDGARIGFTYGVLNNKSLGAKEYKNLVASQEFKDFRAISAVLAAYAAKHLRDAGGLLAMKLFEDGITATDIALMPADLKAEVMQALNTGTELELPGRMAAFEKKFNQVVDGLEKKTALTFEFNSERDFNNRDWAQVTFTPINLYTYLFKSWNNSPAFNAKVSYGLSKDTLTKEPLKRKVMVSEIGFNFPLLMNKKDEPVIEFKPGVKNTYVADRKYDKEKKNNFEPTATFRFRINNNFYLPIKIEYDTEEDNIFGFLSIQYSLK